MTHSPIRADAERRPRASRRAAWCIALTVLSLGSIARADSAAERAERLFVQGQERLRAGDLDQACGLLEASQQTDPALGTLLNLALCHQRQGKTATAFREYVAASVWAEEHGEADAERGRFARAQSSLLASSLSLLRIVVADAPADLTVRLDGASLGASELAVAIPLDPGRHGLEVRAAGKRLWRQDDLRVTAPGTTVVHVFLDEASPPVATPRPSRWPRVAVGSGAALVGVGAGMLIRAARLGTESRASAHDALATSPLDARLKQRSLDAYAHARTWQRAGLAIGGLGAVGLAVGAYAWWRASFTERREQSAWRLAPEIDPRGARLSLTLDR